VKLGASEHSDFEFVSDFELRYSDFVRFIAPFRGLPQATGSAGGSDDRSFGYWTLDVRQRLSVSIEQEHTMKTFEQEIAEVTDWFASSRFEGITRLYSPRQVV